MKPFLDRKIGGSGWRMGWLACGLLFGAVLPACLQTPTATCSSDTFCTDRGQVGRCEAARYCSFPASDCASGFRYGSYASKDLAAQCVAPAASPCGSSACGMLLFGDDFESYSADPWTLGSTQGGKWQSIYVGGGGVTHVVQDPANSADHLLSQEPVGENSNLVTALLPQALGDLDLAVRIRFPVADPTKEAQVLWHTQDPMTTYLLSLSNRWEIRKRLAGVSTVIASGPQAILADGLWHTIRIRQLGANITLFVWDEAGRTWNTLGTATDSSLAPGSIGLAAGHSTTQFDDLKIYLAQ